MSSDIWLVIYKDSDENYSPVGAYNSLQEAKKKYQLSEKNAVLNQRLNSILKQVFSPLMEKVVILKKLFSIPNRAAKAVFLLFIPTTLNV